MMTPRSLLLAAFTLTLACPGSAQAESLACTSGTVSEGDSRLSLLYKCGPPVLSDTACAQVYHSETLNRVPDWVANQWLPCQVTERLLYERGEGNLLATVNVRLGIIRSITYSRQPQ